MAKGETVNELELMYLPLYNSIRKITQLIDESIKFTEKAFKDSEKVMKIIALTWLIGNKLASEEEYK